MERALKKIYENKKLFCALKMTSHICAVLVLLVFTALTASAALRSPLTAVKICTVVGVDFVVVSLARRLINAKRPYEIYDFYETPPKNKRGLSFPSRHTFMAFAASTALLPLSPLFAQVLAFSGMAIALSRVLTGIHFVRDVIAGALLGVIGSVIGLVILF